MSVKAAEKAIRRLVEDGVYEEIGRLKKDNARLREAIRKEAAHHKGCDVCKCHECCEVLWDCEICEIVREEK